MLERRRLCARGREDTVDPVEQRQRSCRWNARELVERITDRRLIGRGPHRRERGESNRQSVIRCVAANCADQRGRARSQIDRIERRHQRRRVGQRCKSDAVAADVEANRSCGRDARRSNGEQRTRIGRNGRTALCNQACRLKAAARVDNVKGCGRRSRDIICIGGPCRSRDLSKVRIGRGIGKRPVGGGKQASVGVRAHILSNLRNDAKAINSRVEIKADGTDRRQRRRSHGYGDAGARIDNIDLSDIADCIKHTRRCRTVIDRRQSCSGSNAGDSTRIQDRSGCGTINRDERVAIPQRLHRCGLCSPGGQCHSTEQGKLCATR